MPTVNNVLGSYYPLDTKFPDQCLLGTFGPKGVEPKMGNQVRRTDPPPTSNDNSAKCLTDRHVSAKNAVPPRVVADFAKKLRNFSSQVGQLLGALYYLEKPDMWDKPDDPPAFEKCVKEVGREAQALQKMKGGPDASELLTLRLDLNLRDLPDEHLLALRMGLAKLPPARGTREEPDVRNSVDAAVRRELARRILETALAVPEAETRATSLGTTRAMARMVRQPVRADQLDDMSQRLFVVARKIAADDGKAYSLVREAIGTDLVEYSNSRLDLIDMLSRLPERDLTAIKQAMPLAGSTQQQVETAVDDVIRLAAAVRATRLKGVETDVHTHADVLPASSPTNKSNESKRANSPTDEMSASVPANKSVDPLRTISLMELLDAKSRQEGELAKLAAGHAQPTASQAKEKATSLVGDAKDVLLWRLRDQKTDGLPDRPTIPKHATGVVDAMDKAVVEWLGALFKVRQPAGQDAVLVAAMAKQDAVLVARAAQAVDKKSPVLPAATKAYTGDQAIDARLRYHLDLLDTEQLVDANRRLHEVVLKSVQSSTLVRLAKVFDETLNDRMTRMAARRIHARINAVLPTADSPPIDFVAGDKLYREIEEIATAVVVLHRGTQPASLDEISSVIKESLAVMVLYSELNDKKLNNLLSSLPERALSNLILPAKSKLLKAKDDSATVQNQAEKDFDVARVKLMTASAKALSDAAGQDETHLKTARKEFATAAEELVRHLASQEASDTTQFLILVRAAAQSWQEIVGMEARLGVPPDQNVAAHVVKLRKTLGDLWQPERRATNLSLALAELGDREIHDVHQSLTILWGGYGGRGESPLGTAIRVRKENLRGAAEVSVKDLFKLAGLQDIVAINAAAKAVGGCIDKMVQGFAELGEPLDAKDVQAFRREFISGALSRIPGSTPNHLNGVWSALAGASVVREEVSASAPKSIHEILESGDVKLQEDFLAFLEMRYKGDTAGKFKVLLEIKKIAVIEDPSLARQAATKLNQFIFLANAGWNERDRAQVLRGKISGVNKNAKGLALAHVYDDVRRDFLDVLAKSQVAAAYADFAADPNRN